MDFSSIMKAATDNQHHAQKEKGLVLKTKLSAPKKDERKVDVAAIKRRLEEEKKNKEKAERLKQKQLAGKQDKPPAAKQTKPTVKPSTPAASGNSSHASKVKEKSKYESKEHKDKHQHFMNKIQKISSKVDAKADSVKPPPKTVRKAADVTKKAKPVSNAPSFQDLMKMAEKVASGEVIPPPHTGKSSSDSKSQSKDNSIANGKSGKVKHGDRESAHNSKHKQSSTSSIRAANKGASSNEKSVNSKSSNSNSMHNKSSNNASSSQKSSQGASSAQKPSSKEKLYSQKLPSGKSVQGKPLQGTTSDGRTNPSVSKNNSNQQKAGAKRPMNGDHGGGPPKKPALSEAARAKLAYREGRRLPPPPSGPNSKGDAPSKTLAKPNISFKKPDRPKMAAPPSNQKAKEGPSKVKEEVKPAVSAWDRLMGGDSAAKKDKSKKKANRYIDSEEEEDDDLDDFIDDGDDEMDYSAAIRDIFGYDKSKYRDEDFDDRSMVAGFADIMKEEVRSAKIGREEDLRDIELEEMEKKKKRLKKKAKGK